MLTLIKAIGAIALGSVIFWNVAQHAGTRNCVAYVHVSALDVDVMIDDDAYHIVSFAETPIVCELGPGRHTLRMARDGRMVFEEEFHLEPGRENVLCAWEPRDEPTAVDPKTQLVINESLAVRPRPVPGNLQGAECTLPGCNPSR